MVNTAELFDAAIAHHQARRLDEAERLYRQILAGEPNNADALHLLGVVAHQRGDHRAGINLIQRALQFAGARADFLCNLGETLRADRQFTAAEQAFRECLRLEPSFVEAHSNFGLALWSQNKIDEAKAAFRRAIELAPTNGDAHHHLGTLLRQQGQWNEAVDHFRRALQANPSSALTYNNLGLTFKALRLFPEASECFTRAARLAPMLWEAHYNHGLLCLEQGDVGVAAVSLRQARALQPRDPGTHFYLCQALARQGKLAEMLAECRADVAAHADSPDAHFHLGLAYMAAGEWPAVEASLAEALRLRPNDPTIALQLGLALDKLDRTEEALASYDRAIALAPSLALAHLNRATILRRRKENAAAEEGLRHALALDPSSLATYNELAILLLDRSQPDNAVVLAERGLQLDPTSAPLHANLGRALLQQGRVELAVEHSRRAVELEPTNAAVHSNLLYRMNFQPGIDAATLFDAHLAWAARHAEPLTARAAPHTNDRSAERRLRIGYVSPYFREHAVNFFSEPLICSHDHAQFEIYCYSDVTTPDEATARIRAAADHWRDVRRSSDEQLANQVRDDAIDILVDLTGHIADNRLLAFARRPAPVQVTYLGYQNTTGMSAMDYRLTDERADPPGATDAYYTEQLVRLPRAFFCYRPSPDAPEVNRLPALERGEVTFGSFNNVTKLNADVIETWASILARVPNSRLLVLAYRGDYLQSQLGEAARRHGVDPSRVELCSKRPRAEYLALMQSVDIALDAFPFNGHTTTCDLVWMGVPVVSLAGDSYASRFGGSVLANVGLESLITTCREDYVQRAVKLAEDLDHLAKLRGLLRSQMAASPLLDFAGFTRHVEAACRRMWRRWCVSSAK